MTSSQVWFSFIPIASSLQNLLNNIVGTVQKYVGTR